MQLKFLCRHSVQKLHNIKCLLFWDKEYFIENSMRMFHVLINVEVRYLKNCLCFILEIPNCAAVSCPNRSTKNLNPSFHRVMSGCKILRRTKPFLWTSISVPSILKRLCRIRLEGTYAYGFSLTCSSFT